MRKVLKILDAKIGTWNPEKESKSNLELKVKPFQSRCWELEFKLRLELWSRMIIKFEIGVEVTIEVEFDSWIGCWN